MPSLIDPTIILYDGVTPHEIQCDSYHINLRRGRNRELADIDAGGGTIAVRNISRNFDPAEFGTGDYGPMKHGAKIEVKDGAVTVFSGFVEDFDYDWRPGGVANATLSVVDGLTTLARTTYLEHTRTNNQRSGDRISEMLDRAEVGYPASPRSIDAGYIRLQGDTVAYGANVLNDLQNIAQTEQGRLFVARDGTLTFLDRYAVFGATPTAAFDDDCAELPFSGMQIAAGSEQIYFKVSVDRVGGVAQTATDAAAIAANPNLGVRHLSLGGLLFTSDAYSKSLAEWLVDRYSVPRLVVSDFPVRLNALDLGDRATVAALDIGAVLDVDWTPAEIGDPVSQLLAVEGVSYQSESNGQTVMSFQLSDATAPEFFTLDTDELDGEVVLGF